MNIENILVEILRYLYFLYDMLETAISSTIQNAASQDYR